MSLLPFRTLFFLCSQRVGVLIWCIWFCNLLEGFVNAVTGKTETTDFQTTVSASMLRRYQRALRLTDWRSSEYT